MWEMMPGIKERRTGTLGSGHTIIF